MDAWKEKEFCEQVEQCRSKIISHLLAVLKNETDVEDVWQLAVIKAYQHQEQFEGRSQFSTWLWRIAHNSAIDVLRKRKNHLPLEEEKREGSVQEKSLEIAELAEKLPLKQREVFILYAIENKSQKEIAQILNIPYGTVRSRLFTARKLLAKLFQQEMI